MFVPADLYDYIYAWKDYHSETQRLIGILGGLGLKKGSVLELACGTGQYLSHMNGWSGTGVDLCQRSLLHAQKRSPQSLFVHANMKETGLNQQFDVILCLFGGIAYLSVDEIDIAIKHWSSLLRAGGILVIEPWLEEEQIDFGVPFVHTYKKEDLFVSRAVVPQKNKETCRLEFYFLLLHNNEIHRMQTLDVLHLYQKNWLLDKMTHNNFEMLLSEKGFLQEGSLFFFQKKSE